MHKRAYLASRHCRLLCTGTQFHVRAKAVVNATGQFADAVRQFDKKDTQPICQPGSGVHIILPDYYWHAVCTRTLFLIIKLNWSFKREHFYLCCTDIFVDFYSCSRAYAARAIWDCSFSRRQVESLRSSRGSPAQLQVLLVDITV